MRFLCTTYHARQFGAIPFLKNNILTTCLILFAMFFCQHNLLAQVTPNEGEVQCFLAGTGAIFTDFGGVGGDNATEGAAGNYLNCDCVTTTTICTPDASAMTAEFTNFGVFSEFDWLVILDIDNPSEEMFPSAITDDPTNATLQLFNSSNGIGNGNAEAYGPGANVGQNVLTAMTTTTFTSTNAAGCLTFVFRASGVVDDLGWDVTTSAASGIGHPGDNLACGTNVDCFPPSNIAVANITGVSADVTWENTTNATSTTVEYGPAGFTPGTGTTITTTDLSASFTNLEELTSYDVYIQTDCGATDGLSINVGPISFMTDFINPPQNCSYTLNLFDSFGDGWNGSILTITHNGVSTDYTIFDDCINDNGFFATFQIDVFEGLPIDFNYQVGGFQNEVTYEFIDPSGNVAFSDGPTPALGDVFSEIAVCPDCPSLDEELIAFTNVTSDGITMNWMGLDEAMTYTLEWGTEGFTPSMGTIENATSTTFDFTGLAENTLYDVYIFANCSMEDGAAIGPFTFQTGFVNPPGICTYSLELNDTGFGNDGWDGSTVDITINNITTSYTLSCLTNNGISETFDIPVLNGFNIEVSYTQVGFNGFNHNYTLYDADELPVFSDGPNPVAGVVYDEVVICPDCPILDDDFINFSDITFDGAMMNWVGIDTALSYTLEWGLEGFTYGDGTVENTTEEFFAFSGLTENTLYDVYIFTNCNGGVGQPIGPFTFQTGFVDPPGMCNFTLQLNDTGYGTAGWDGSFVSVTTNNITTLYTLNGLDDDGVSETFTIPVLVGFDIVVGYTQVGFNGFNHNYILADSDGLPLYTAGPNPEAGTEVFTTVGFCPDCPAASPPSAFQVGTLTDNTAMLTWENVDIAMTYIIEYGPTGFPLGQGLTTTSTTNTVELTGLNTCVTYDAYVTVDCGGEGISTTVGPVTFTTTFSAPPNDCPIVLDAFMQDVNANNATVEWMGDDNATASYIVEYGTLGFTLGTGISATVGNSISSFQMNNLEENTWYNVYITTDCDADTSKTFGPISFQTIWLNDVGVGTITNPTNESCNLTGNEIVTIGLTNFGQNPQSLFEYYFAVNGQLAPISPPTDGFFTGVVGNDSTLLVDFETTWDFSVPGFYLIEAWTNLDGDSDSSNDTLRIEIVTAFPLPLMEDFEGGEVPEGWITDEAFGIYDDAAHGNVTTVLGDNMFSGDQSFEIITPRFGPINDGDSLSFDYRYTVWSAGTAGQEIGGNFIEVQVSEDCAETWTTIFTVDESNHTTTADATTRFVDLSAYAGSALNVRFLATWQSGDYWLDMDNINILGCPPSLGLMANINNPTIGIGDDGSIGIDPMFGTPPYDFDWNTNDNTSTIEELVMGEYIVTVTDALGCQDVRAYVLEETVSASEVEVIQNIVLSPNPTTGLATLNLQLNRSVDVDIQVFNVTGQVIETVSQRQISNLTQDFDLTNQAAGMYFVRVMIEGASHYERVVLTK